MFRPLFQKMKDYGAPIVSKKGMPKEPFTKKFLFLLSVGKNALVVVFCAVLALILDNYDHKPFSLTGKSSLSHINVI